MATTFVDVLLQLRDELGADALSGGKIETFDAGTTTPRVTYQDLAGNIANTNPVILDSSGMAIIRQTDGVAYKWVVYDADDNLLWTRDDITVGIAASSSTDSYLVHMSFQGIPTAAGFMAGHIFEEAVTLPIDFEGAQGWVETAPASDFTISIKKNGSEIGTATISSAGAYAFETTSHTTVSFSAGDKLQFYAPASLTGASSFIVTLVGSV